MRAARHKHNLVFLGFVFVVLLLPASVQAQSFGGGTSASLYTGSGTGLFQSSTGIQQATQGTTQSASSSNVLQTTTVTTLVVVGAPASTTSAQSSSPDNESSSEIMVISALAGLFAIGALFVLWRQIKNSP